MAIEHHPSKEDARFIDCNFTSETNDLDLISKIMSCEVHKFEKEIKYYFNHGYTLIDDDLLHFFTSSYIYRGRFRLYFSLLQGITKL